ncbi:hypothetical protein V7S43_012850 [Phytophthora oleae]|uniref:Uncharacterized protein n=1 Tax=Phytophthora oleae TaxID=2107226 RepID=A0ABD3F5C7_9STRA
MEPKLQLTITRCIFREKLSAEAVETVSAIVSNFLVADMTLARACELSRVGTVALPTLMWNRRQQHSDGKWSELKTLYSKPRYFRSHFTQALIQTVRCGDLKMVGWLLLTFQNNRLLKMLSKKLLETDKWRLSSFLGKITWMESWIKLQQVVVGT